MGPISVVGLLVIIFSYRSCAVAFYLTTGRAVAIPFNASPIASKSDRSPWRVLSAAGHWISTLQNYLRQERSNRQPKQRLLEVEVVPKATAGTSQAMEIIAPNGYRIMVVARFEAEDLLRLLRVREQIKATGL